MNYGKEAENECFAQGLVGKDKKRRREDSEVKMLWVAFRGENAIWWRMADEICSGAGTHLQEG